MIATVAMVRKLIVFFLYFVIVEFGVNPCIGKNLTSARYIGPESFHEAHYVVLHPAFNQAAIDNADHSRSPLGDRFSLLS